MISAVSIRCKVGNFEVLRSPKIIIESKRRQVLGRASIEVPDADGKLRASLKIKDKVQIILRYRGQDLEQTWQGTIESIKTSTDSLIVQAVGLEKALMDTIITESFYNEPVNIVAKRLLERTGFNVASVDIGDYVLPHQVFSAIPVARAIKQLEQSITRSFSVDMTKHALWLDNNQKWHWKDGDETGNVFRIETAKNLLSHKPAQKEGEMGEITTVLLPSLSHSRLISIRDKVRDVALTVRVQEVVHECGGGGNRTRISYGKNEGWG